MSQLPEVQQSVRALDGVSGAYVRWPDPNGPASLHVQFAEGADRDAVRDQIAAILRDVGGVDLATLEVADHPGDSSGLDESADARPGRAAFAGLLVDQNNLDAAVDVTLLLHGRRITGHAEGLATGHALPRTAATATLGALREILPDGFRAELDWLRVVEVDQHDVPAVVQTAVTVLTRNGNEQFVGSAIVRGDVKEAAVRATLSALNRRIERNLQRSA